MGIVQKGGTLVLLKQKRVKWFLALRHGAARALNTSKTRSSASDTRPRCLGSPITFFPIFEGVTRSNCSAENEGLCEYPFLQRNQEGTSCRQLDVYLIPLFVCLSTLFCEVLTLPAAQHEFRRSATTETQRPKNSKWIRCTPGCTIEELYTLG